MIEDKYRKIADYVAHGIEGIKRTGLKVLEMRERYVKLLLPLEGNVNHVGMMYAGSLFTIGEVTGGAIHGAAFDIEKFFPIVKEVSIRFRRPAVTEVTVEVTISEEEANRIQSEADDNGKADFVMDIDIKDANGEVVSIVHGVWQIRKIPEGMQNPLTA